MSPLARFLTIAATVLGASAAVLLWSGFAAPVSVSFQMAPPPPPAPQASEPQAAAIANSATPTGDAAGETGAFAAPPLDLGRTIPAWERQIELAATQPAKSASDRARAVLALLPALPEEALAEAAERAVDALPDADYAAVALPVATNPRTHPRALSVLFSDLMERPDSIALAALLAIARNPEHAFAPSAKDNLQFLLGTDFGADWARWEAEIQRVLARQKR